MRQAVSIIACCEKSNGLARLGENVILNYILAKVLCIAANELSGQV